MASTDKTAASPLKSEAPPVAAARCPFNYSLVDVTLRVLLFAATLSSVVVMVTSKQTELVPVPVLPTVRVRVPAKFNHSPAFIYFIAALSVTGLYSIITILASVSIVLKPTYSKSILLAFALLDVVFVGIVASATGAAGGVAYIGLRGNSHVGWNKICGVYDKFCRYIGSSIALSLFAAILLVLLSMMSTFTLYKKIRDRQTQLQISVTTFENVCVCVCVFILNWVMFLSVNDVWLYLSLSYYYSLFSSICL